MTYPALILASASPRRAELLRAAGISFQVRVADIDETPQPGESPTAYVLRLAREKARAVARPGELVLGADTTVLIGTETAGKPENAADAERMLRALSGAWHEVLTAVTLLRDGQELSDVAVTRVKFASLTEEEIQWYVATGEPYDKAGAYAIQGYASLFIERIEGSYFNVVGLPVQMVYRLAREMGVDLRRVRTDQKTVNNQS
ncbi:MAG TPA: Maf family protein [Blastocatellia bacterium]|nr:Maf family protein [Blastocatellia bacterium]